MQVSFNCVAPIAGHGSARVRPHTVKVARATGQCLRMVRAQKNRQGSRRATSTLVCQASLDAATVTNAAYVGLGLAGLSFVGTFFVAPQFKDSFKEDLDWRAIYTALAARGVEQLEPAEAFAKSNSGAAILLDVRLNSKYEASHAAGSLSTPLYLPIQKWDVASIIRRAGFAFFGIYGTELNTNFASEVLKRVPKGVQLGTGKQIIVVCESGGSMDNKSGTKFGFQSRSLKAVFYLQQAGFNQVAYVKGGLPAWSREGYPMAEGPEDLSSVPALRAGSVDEGDTSSKRGIRLPGGIVLPQLSFGPARR